MAEPAERRFALEGRFSGHADVVIEPARPALRASLRAPKGSISSLSRAIGVELPVKPGTSAVSGTGRIAMWLGPDEWLIVDVEGKDPAAACAGVKAFHSAVDISHRNIAITVTGRAAENVLNAGCPLDLSLAAFGPGRVARTVCGKAEIVLFRQSEDRFRVECWRSFSDYVFSLLAEAARSAP
jgi:sarcosine oxidase subunit gamma